MDWKSAKRAQLYEIAYNDKGAPLEYKVAAAAEIKRRNRQKQSSKPVLITNRMELRR